MQTRGFSTWDFLVRDLQLVRLDKYLTKWPDSIVMLTYMFCWPKLLECQWIQLRGCRRRASKEPALHSRLRTPGHVQQVRGRVQSVCLCCKRRNYFHLQQSLRSFVAGYRLGSIGSLLIAKIIYSLEIVDFWLRSLLVDNWTVLKIVINQFHRDIWTVSQQPKVGDIFSQNLTRSDATKSDPSEVWFLVGVGWMQAHFDRARGAASRDGIRVCKNVQGRWSKGHVWQVGHEGEDRSYCWER